MKSRATKQIIGDLVVKSILMVIHAVGKGMVKFANQQRRPFKVGKPTLASNRKAVRSLKLK